MGMKTMLKYGWLYVVLLVMAGSCAYEFPEAEGPVSAGNVSFRHYVSIGGYGMSGFMHGAFYTKGQQQSVSAILYEQFLKTGQEIPFNQADIGTENGYNEFYQSGTGISGRFVYRYTDYAQDEPVITAEEGDMLSDYGGNIGQVNDLGIPFLKSFQMNNGEAAVQNPYVARLNLPYGVTLTEHVLAMHPEFFTIWLGVAEIFNYARSGGEGSISSVPGEAGEFDLSSATEFEENLTVILEQLLYNPATRGAIANIPDLKDLPFFFYYPYNFLRITTGSIQASRAEYVDAFNEAVDIHNIIPGAERRPYISWDDNGAYLSPQRLVVEDDSLCDAYYPNGEPLPKIRQIEPEELVLLSIPVGEVKTGLGWMYPLPAEYYLNKYQVQKIQVRINEFNAVISGMASRYSGQLALVDLRSAFALLALSSRKDVYGNPGSYEEHYFNGVPLHFDLGLYSLVSLDGIYPNQRGNAYIANRFIEAINRSFGSELPIVDINRYTGNTVELGIR
ncbi:MAG TPA: hypothetical protein ENN63_00835 [Bacteroidetes bacterium]|nr:hypothetical protein [Bacteroidota bacterium]